MQLQVCGRQVQLVGRDFENDCTKELENLFSVEDSLPLHGVNKIS